MAESEIEFIFLGSAPTTSVAASKFNHLGEGADDKENVIEAALQGQQTFSIKDQTVNILGFAIHSVSMVTTQLNHCSRKAAAKCCISIKSYLPDRDTAFAQGKQVSFLFRSCRTFQQSLTVCRLLSMSFPSSSATMC